MDKYKHTRLHSKHLFRVKPTEPITIEDIWATEDFLQSLGYDITGNIHHQFCKRYNIPIE